MRHSKFKEKQIELWYIQILKDMEEIVEAISFLSQRKKKEYFVPGQQQQEWKRASHFGGHKSSYILQLR